MDYRGGIVTFRLLGLPEELRLAIEQAGGSATEEARLVYEAAVNEAVSQVQQTVMQSLTELQTVIGPHGTISRVQSGGIRVSPGEGVGVYSDGVFKTNIQPNGTLVVGSDIENPATTTEVFFVEDTAYNGEQFGAGDFLIGDNSTDVSNVKWDASEGQLQFRLGTIVNAYMDTDGKLKAGSGALTLDADGVALTEAGDAFLLRTGEFDAVISHVLNATTGNRDLNFLVYEANTDSLISNGDFEDGLTGWTDVDAGSNVSLDTAEFYEGGASLRFTGAVVTTDYIEQSITAQTYGIIVRFRAKISASLGVIKITGDSSSKTFDEINTEGEWRTFYGVLRGATSNFRIGVSNQSGNSIWIDDITVRSLDGAGTQAMASSYSFGPHLLTIDASNFFYNDPVPPGKSVFAYTSSTGRLVFNDNSADIDVIIRGDTDSSLTVWDAGLDAVGFGGAAQSGYKVKVHGKVNLTSGNTYDINGTPHTHNHRELLAATRTYYVRSDGSDSNTGLADTAGGAFLTIQKAVDVAYGTLDLYGYDVTIQVGAGTFAGANVLFAQVGKGTITIQGDTTTPSNVLINTGGFAAYNYCTVKIQGFKIAGPTTAILAQGAYIKLGNMNFGACSFAHMLSVGGSGLIEVIANYSITGNSGSHHHASNGGWIEVAPTRTITLTGTPAFTQFALSQSLGQVRNWANTFSGSATGKRYAADMNAIIQTFGGGANYFPGNAAGTTATGGQYA